MTEEARREKESLARENSLMLDSYLHRRDRGRRCIQPNECATDYQRPKRLEIRQQEKQRGKEVVVEEKDE